MKYLILTILIGIFSVIAYSQQYEDIVYLKNGSIVHGIITEQIPGESIKIKTKDGNTFVFSMNEIEKLTKEEIIIKKEVTKIDSTVKIAPEKKEKPKKKLLIAKNSLTIQPFGLVTVLTNLEYDRAITGGLSSGIKFSYMTFWGKGLFSFTGDSDDVEKAELYQETISAWGIGSHIRYYTGGKAVQGFFLGLAFEKISASYDELDIDSLGRRKVENMSAGILRIEAEIGNRIKLSDRQAGFTILWTLGGGVGFLSRDNEDTETVPVGSIGFGIGYSF